MKTFTILIPQAHAISACAPKAPVLAAPPVAATSTKGHTTTVGGKHAYVPDAGFVPDAATAIRIAEAVWIPIYGEENVAKEKPFRAVLHTGVWTVTGTLPKPSQQGRVIKGGVAEADISQKDGRIIRVSHGK